MFTSSRAEDSRAPSGRNHCADAVTRVLVLGGTRFVGPFVVRQLLAAGHNVTVFPSRGDGERPDRRIFSGLGHVGLYRGRGEMVHAPYTGKNVEIVALGGSHYGRRLVGARRVEEG